MRHDHPRVRVLTQQRIEHGHVRGRLQHPTLAAKAVLQELQHPAVVRVDRLLVDAGVPRGERWGLLAADPLLARERRHREPDALTRNTRPHLVHRAVLGYELVPELDVGLALLDARVRFVGRLLGRRARVPRLPRQRHPMRGVLRQQLVQDRRPRARQTDDEERPLDALVRDRGRGPVRLLDAQPRLERVHDVGAAQDATDQGELRFRVEASAEDLEPLAPDVVRAEVRQAGVVPGLGQQ